MEEIIKISALQILDSRGMPTVEAEVTTKSGCKGVGIVPSGASTGKYEAVELRDNNPAFFKGKSVYQAIKNILGPIQEAILGRDVNDQTGIDRMLIDLDGSPNKSNLGANAILAVSMACMRAAAQYANTSLYNFLRKKKSYVLPVPLVNVLNGGAHAHNSFDFQEFMLAPVGATSFSEAVRMAAEIFFSLKEILKVRGLSTNVGDEGGFAPRLNSNEEGIELLLEAIEKSGYKPGKHVFISIDAASSEFYNVASGLYTISKPTKETLNSAEMIKLWSSWSDKYPILSIEDGLSEDDWAGWQSLTKALGGKIRIVGDDLLTTNIDHLKKSIELGATNSILIKLNQIGTITEALEVVRYAQSHSILPIISHRSGETEDTTISDLAVGLGIHYIKCGSMSRGERTAKYNRLLRIEKELGDRAVYAGCLAK